MNNNEIDRLVSGWCTETITPDDFKRLEAELLQNPEARKALRKHASLDLGLRDWAAVGSEQAWNLPQRRAELQKSRPVLFGRWMSIAASIGLLCFGMYVWGAKRHTSPVATAQAAPVEATGTGCAVLAAGQVIWDGAPPAVGPGDVLAPGILKLKSGLAQVEFFSGATAIVEGPAEFRVVSASEAECLAGAIRIRVSPAARGFRLRSSGLDLIDLGTEFGVSAHDGNSEVHVFDGKVSINTPGGEVVNLTQGDGWRQGARAAVNAGQFPTKERVAESAAKASSARFESWQAATERRRHDARLIALYEFTPSAEWNRLLPNLALPNDPDRAGGIVGAAWATGRWPQKGSLEFKRPGDRVRLNLPGVYTAVSMSCWIKPDGLDREYNALLLTDGYDPGEPHWQIVHDGRLMFSVSYPDPSNPPKNRNQAYYSPVIFTPSSVGRWHHLAVTYDGITGTAIQYVDGREVSRDGSPFHAPGRTLVYGPCEIGNWGLPGKDRRFPLRNLNGGMDEFIIFSAVLNADEIHEIYETGKPE